MTTYLIVRCLNGPVVFELTRLELASGVSAFCWTDGTTLTSRPAGGFNPQTGIEALFAKAVALRGAIQQAFEINV